MLVPYEDINPTDRTPYMTWGLIAINAVVFLMTFEILTMPPPQQVEALYAWGALVPAQFELMDIFTSMFLHGGIGHIVGNMLFLYITGDNIEDEMGSWAFVYFYVFCGAVAGMAHVAMAPGSAMPMVGASGAISGVMGAYIVLFPHSRIKIFYWLFFFWMGSFTLKAMWWLGLWFGFQLLSGASAGSTGGGVAYAAHIGGFVVGVVCALVGKQVGWLEGGVKESHQQFRT